MSQQELDEIRASMGECERLEALLEAAKQRRTQLATRLYEANGPTRTYQLAEIPGVCDAVELLVSRTKPRRDGTVSYFFAEKQRWRGPRPTVAIDIETQGVSRGLMAPEPKVITSIPLTGRVIEATANLTGRSQAGPETEDDAENEFDPSDPPRILPLRLCGVCREPQQETFHGAVCANGHGGAPSLFDSLPPEELASVPVPSQAEIEGAIEQGRSDAEAIRASRGGVRLPIVGEGKPEPRLLQIQEPSQADPDDAVLDDILASLDDV